MTCWMACVVLEIIAMLTRSVMSVPSWFGCRDIASIAEKFS